MNELPSDYIIKQFNYKNYKIDFDKIKKEVPDRMFNIIEDLIKEKEFYLLSIHHH